MNKLYSGIETLNMEWILIWYKMFTECLNISGNTPQMHEIFYWCIHTYRQDFFQLIKCKTVKFCLSLIFYIFIAFYFLKLSLLFLIKLLEKMCCFQCLTFSCLLAADLLLSVFYHHHHSCSKAFLWMTFERLAKESLKKEGTRENICYCCIVSHVYSF